MLLTILSKFRHDLTAICREYLAICKRVAEALEVMKPPDDFFLAIDFDDLRVLLTCVTIPDYKISRRQLLKRRDPS